MISISPKEFQLLADYIHTKFGIHLKKEKTALVLGRLGRYLQQQQFASFSDYYEYVVSDRTGKAASELADRISTNHTFFMREQEHFYYLRDYIFPELVHTVRDRDLRIWCAGCSYGQESYVLAMLAADFFATQSARWDTSILATDISEKALAYAKQGRYPAHQMEALPKYWRLRHFTRDIAGTYTVSEWLKSRVIYRKFNLMDPVFPFRKKFQVIFCRNVMIYFDAPTKEALVNKFLKITEPGGYLFVSHSESLQYGARGYRYVMPGVYRKEY